MVFDWPPYPPCVSSGCSDPQCCDFGGNYRWPNLVGKKWEYAKRKIEEELPNVGVVIFKKGMVRIEDFCCNRVFIYINNSGIVVEVPTIG